MDLVYVPDVLSFGSFRSSQYRDYEQPWNRNYFDDGKTTSSYYHHRQQQQLQQQNHRESSSKDSCYLCKENKRRSLAAYIRGKTRKNSCNEICEEEEEEIRETKEALEEQRNEHQQSNKQQPTMMIKSK